MTDPVRTIKKYPNRRLYDTANSGYITLADVKQMVLENIEFQVIDAKSGDDLTRSILLQIILDEEGGGVPMFSPEMLSQMIRFYGSAQQTIMGQYMEQNVKAFLTIQKKLQDQAKQVYGDKMLRRRCRECWGTTSNRAPSCSWTCSRGCRIRLAACSPRSPFPTSVHRRKQAPKTIPSVDPAKHRNIAILLRRVAALR